MKDNPVVREYMSHDAASVDPSTTVKQASERISATDYDGLSVCHEGTLCGYVTSKSLLCQPADALVGKVTDEPIITIRPDMSVEKTTRVMFRQGRGDLPVVDEEDELLGVITNTDILRSHIERATPSKIQKLTRMLENVHSVSTTVTRETVSLGRLRPTQTHVYRDELQGRRYELENGLAEPLIVVDSGDECVLTDGHHRASAARKLGYDRLDAYVISLSRPVELGLVKTAKQQNLARIEDISIIEDSNHPLTDKTRIENTQ